MQCPRCKTHDVYRSNSGNKNVFSLWTVAARCHRCCLLFSVPRWKTVPDKPHKLEMPEQQPSRQQERRAA